VTGLDIRLSNGALIGTSGYGLPSPDVALQHGSRAEHCRFKLDIEMYDENDASSVSLVVYLQDAPEVVVDIATRVEEQLKCQSYNPLFSRFFDLVAEWKSPTVVEIGARKSPGDMYAKRLPTGSRYVGFDIKSGPNVDVVGDAHRISDYFSEASIDAVFAASTIEHLAMPWKAIIEVNCILKPRGLVFFVTHQTWPVHEAPWDYWRLSEHAWRVLLNETTGFEIIEAAMGDGGTIVADLIQGGTVGLDRQPAFLHTWVLARKTGPTTLRWDVDPEMIVDRPYPG